jgi:putative resolvase
MKLSEWAKQQGITYKTAHRMFQAGTLPIRTEQFQTGTIIVHPEKPVVQRVVLYGRVSSADQKEDLRRQMERLRAFCMGRGWQIDAEVTDVGSGLNEARKGILKLLSDSTATHIVVEHRDRLARFGAEMIAATLEATGRQLVIVNQTEFKDDLVQDFVDIVTRMCARIYGKRAAKNRAQRALNAASGA